MDIPIIGEINIGKHWGMIIALLAVLYIISPIDFIPDFIPFLGWIDDLVVLLIGLGAFFKGNQ